MRFKFLCFILAILYFSASTPCWGQERTIGIFQNDEESFNGYSLFSNSRASYLIDNCGFEVHSWTSNYRPGLSVYLLENGQLLRTTALSSQFNAGGAGGGFELVNWDSSIDWSYDMSSDTIHPHHDIAPLPNGNFLALVWTKMSGEEVEALGRINDLEVWMEEIYEIKPIGDQEIEIVWHWSMRDRLIQDRVDTLSNFGVIADHPEKMNFNYGGSAGLLKPDWGHFNAIDYNESLDQIAISSRNFSEIWVIDHSTTTEEASTGQGGNSGMGGDIIYRYGNPQVYNRGNSSDQILYNQHNITWCAEDSPYPDQFMVFNNNWMVGLSSVERWDPPYDGYNYSIDDASSYEPTETEWMYTDSTFFSSRVSGAQLMSNGNVLICEGKTGRFFEVTESGEKVWEYKNPVGANSGPVAQGTNPVAVSTFRVLRYPPDFDGLSDKELIPIAPLEIDPLPFDCDVFGPSMTESINLTDIRILGNPTIDDLRLEVDAKVDIEIYDNFGSKVLSRKLAAGEVEINISDLHSGMYYLASKGSNGLRSVLKFIKL